jgi:hypothetical protein
MHYPPDAFGKRGAQTIVALKPLNGAVMGQRKYISDGDITRLRKMYKCK